VTLEEQRLKLKELIETGRKLVFESGVRTGRTRDISGILIPQSEFERWMGQINTFNSRYLKNHPQHSDIYTKFFHRKNYFNSHTFFQHSYDLMMIQVFFHYHD
jgi:hypothetical protein